MDSLRGDDEDEHEDQDEDMIEEPLSVVGRGTPLYTCRYIPTTLHYEESRLVTLVGKLLTVERVGRVAYSYE